jgi:hypothetical protein
MGVGTAGDGGEAAQKTAGSNQRTRVNIDCSDENAAERSGLCYFA